MTKTQSLIISMLEHGYRDGEISHHTDKSKSYISHVRRQLAEDPHYFDTKTIINKINNDKPPEKAAIKDYSGYASCLATDCDKTFWSEDRRRNRICPKCTEAARYAGYMRNVT